MKDFSETFWSVFFTTALQNYKYYKLLNIIGNVMLVSKVANNYVNSRYFMKEFCIKIFPQRIRRKRYRNIDNIKQIRTDLERWYLPQQFYFVS